MLPEFPNLKIETTMSFTSKGAQRIYEYWNSKCNDRLPTWSDIALMDIYELAPNIMVKEFVDDIGDWRNRYFGSGLTETLGIEGTRKFLTDYHSKENASKACNFFNSIRESKLATKVAGQCIVKNREYRTLEGVYLPLIDKTGNVNMVFCYEDYS